MDERSVGVYLHVPFCERICPYCDFPVVAARRLDAGREAAYVGALLAELAQRRGEFAEHHLASIYLGGGTPSLLDAQSVARLVAGVRDAFPEAAAELEITLELNPSTVERERLPGFRAAGVNRLSVGIQSFDDTLLRRLGRAHRAGESRETLGAVRRAGFENFSLDLIFAGPGQRLAGLERDVIEALSFAPVHLSTYALTVEPGTPFALAARRGQLGLPAEDEAARMMEWLDARLDAAGLPAYEISSFARPGFESRHNQRYWRRLPVLGLGLGAWSTLPAGPGCTHGARVENVRSLETYLARVGAGRSPATGPAEVLAPETARGEAVFLALRTRAGLDARGFLAEFGASPRSFFGTAIDELCAAALVHEDASGDLHLTSRGRLLSDSVFERFV